MCPSAARRIHPPIQRQWDRWHTPGNHTTCALCTNVTTTSSVSTYRQAHIRLLLQQQLWCKVHSFCSVNGVFRDFMILVCFLFQVHFPCRVFFRSNIFSLCSELRIGPIYKEPGAFIISRLLVDCCCCCCFGLLMFSVSFHTDGLLI